MGRWVPLFDRRVFTNVDRAAQAAFRTRRSVPSLQVPHVAQPTRRLGKGDSRAQGQRFDCGCSGPRP